MKFWYKIYIWYILIDYYYIHVYFFCVIIPESWKTPYLPTRTLPTDLWTRGKPNRPALSKHTPHTVTPSRPIPSKLTLMITALQLKLVLTMKNSHIFLQNMRGVRPRAVTFLKTNMTRRVSMETRHTPLPVCRPGLSPDFAQLLTQTRQVILLTWQNLRYSAQSLVLTSRGYTTPEYTKFAGNVSKQVPVSYTFRHQRAVRCRVRPDRMISVALTFSRAQQSGGGDAVCAPSNESSINTECVKNVNRTAPTLRDWNRRFPHYRPSSYHLCHSLV